MSNVYFISDLHIAHAKVITFENYYRAGVMGVSTIEEHDNKLYNQIVDNLSKRDVLFLLGDNGECDAVYKLLKACPARINYIPGNHDKHKAIERWNRLQNITIWPPGTYKGYWVTHHPIHPIELYGRKNIHGHVHSKSLKDEQYINLSVEATKGMLVPFEDIRSGVYTTHNRPF